MYKSNLLSSEDELRKTLKESEVTQPYYISQGVIYHGDSYLPEIESIKPLIEIGKPVNLKENLTTTFEVLRKLTYFGFANTMDRNGFQSIKGRSPVYYLPESKLYVMKLVNDIGTFTAFRGFTPLLENHLKDGKLAIYIKEDTIFRVEEPINNWKFWEGSIAGVRFEFRSDMDTKGGVTIERVDEESRLAVVTKYGTRREISLEGIYILGNSPNLRKAGVYQALSRFARYKNNTSAMYVHLMNFTSKFTENDIFEIAFDEAKQNRLCFFGENEEVYE